MKQIQVLGISYLSPAIKSKITKQAISLGAKKESIGCIWIIAENEVKDNNGVKKMESKLIAQVTDLKLSNTIRFDLKDIL